MMNGQHVVSGFVLRGTQVAKARVSCKSTSLCVPTAEGIHRGAKDCGPGIMKVGYAF